MLAGSATNASTRRSSPASPTPAGCLLAGATPTTLTGLAHSWAGERLQRAGRSSSSGAPLPARWPHLKPSDMKGSEPQNTWGSRGSLVMSLPDAVRKCEACRRDSNEERPHSACQPSRRSRCRSGQRQTASPCSQGLASSQQAGPETGSGSTSGVTRGATGRQPRGQPVPGLAHPALIPDRGDQQARSQGSSFSPPRADLGTGLMPMPAGRAGRAPPAGPGAAPALLSPRYGQPASSCAHA